MVLVGGDLTQLEAAKRLTVEQYLILLERNIKKQTEDGRRNNSKV